MRVAPEAQAAEFAANILPIIRMTGIGPVPRVRDRVNEGSERIRAFLRSPRGLIYDIVRRRRAPSSRRSCR